MIEEVKDRANYSVAFLGMVLAFTSIKVELAGIYVSLGFINTNLFFIILFFIGLYSLSVYINALNYLRFNLPSNASKKFNWLQYLAQYLDILAILSPLIIFTIWIFNIFLGYVFNLITLYISFITPQPVFSTFRSILSFVLGASLGVATVQLLIAIRKRAFNRVRQNIEDDYTDYLKRLDGMYDKKYYSSVIIEFFKLVIIALKQQLSSKGFFVDKMLPYELFKLAFTEKLISKDQYTSLYDFRSLRNLAAHSSTNFSKKEAEFAKKITKEILDNLKSK